MWNGSRLIWPSAVTNMCDRNMTNLWLWNCFRNPRKLSRINTFYSTGKYSEFFKVWVRLFAMELDARELFRCTWLQLPWWKIVGCFKSRLHCTRLYIAFKAQKLLEVSEVFWSFTCIFKSKLLCTQSRLTKSEGRNIKLRCYRESQNSFSGTRNVFSETTPWL